MKVSVTKDVSSIKPVKKETYWKDTIFLNSSQKPDLRMNYYTAIFQSKIKTVTIIHFISMLMKHTFTILIMYKREKFLIDKGWQSHYKSFKWYFLCIQENIEDLDLTIYN